MKNLTRVAIAFIKNDRTHFLHERVCFLSTVWMGNESPQAQNDRISKFLRV